jgi:AraC family transcriptional regulator
MTNIEPRIEHGRQMLIAGLRGRFSGASMNDIPEQWARFGAYLGKIPGQVGQTAYGVCFERSNAIDYLSGVEVSPAMSLPGELSLVEIPAQKYAVFTHSGHASELRGTLDLIWNKWLPLAGLRARARMDDAALSFFERYGKDFDPKTGLGDIEVWVPIQP